MPGLEGISVQRNLLTGLDEVTFALAAPEVLAFGSEEEFLAMIDARLAAVRAELLAAYRRLEQRRRGG